MPDAIPGAEDSEMSPASVSLPLVTFLGNAQSGETWMHALACQAGPSFWRLLEHVVFNIHDTEAIGLFLLLLFNPSISQPAGKVALPFSLLTKHLITIEFL